MLSYSLCFDTSAQFLTIGLKLCDGALVDQIAFDAEYNHAELLLGQVDELLQRNKIDYKALASIGVVSGPGSYTGIRIGLSAAKAFGLSLGIPVYAVTAFEALAHAYKRDHPDCLKKILVTIDSRKDDFFCQIFDPDLKASPEFIADAEQLKNYDVESYHHVGAYDQTQPYIFVEATALCTLIEEASRGADGDEVRPFYMRQTAYSQLI